MIVTRIKGGLGNQLFSYAAGRRLALANNTEMVIDDVSGFARDFTYQRSYQLHPFRIPCRIATKCERLEPFSRIRRGMKIKLNQFRTFEHRTYIKQEGVDFDPRLLRVQGKRRIYLDGYWQSEDYFKDFEATIRSELQISAPEDPKNRACAFQIQSGPSVAVHVRFFNPPGVSGNDNAPAKYYRQAIALMEKNYPGAHYFIFSDRPESARAMIPLKNNRVTCVFHNDGDAQAYADLWLMTLCDHYIIANSTFSWWGAWLGESYGTMVIAPSLQLKEEDGVTSWNFPGQLPQRWTLI